MSLLSDAVAFTPLGRAADALGFASKLTGLGGNSPIDPLSNVVNLVSGLANRLTGSGSQDPDPTQSTAD